MRLPRLLVVPVLLGLLALPAPVNAADAAAAGGVVAGPAKAQLLADGRYGGTSVSAVNRSAWPRSTGTSRFGAAAVTGATAVFRVNYDSGFTPAARAAFQRAVDIWARNVSSAVPIVIDARYLALPPGVLGAAGPAASYVEDVDGRYDAEDTVYPIALANARAGRDLAPGRPDIDAEFNSRATELFTGTGPVPDDKYDLTSVVLHEIGHGLGVIGLIDYEEGMGTLDPRSSDPLPAIYDRFPVVDLGDGRDRPVLDYPRRSRELGAAITGNDLYWDGSVARSVNGGVRPKLYAPSPYEASSSYSHLDEDTFPTGSPDALMTPRLRLGETIRDPGNVLLGMFADMGWSVPLVPGARFTTLEPRRLLDTRSGTGVTGGSRRVGAAGVVDLRVRGGVTGVPSDATAVVLNVTAVGATQPTDVRVYPRPRDNGRVPLVSNLNLRRGETRANLVTVPIGRADSVRLRNAAGSVALLADLAGYYAASAASTYHPVSPQRLLDTRTTATRRLAAGATLDVQVAGLDAVPGTASAVVLTVTAVQATGPTDLRIYPTSGDGAVPEISNLNVAGAAAVPNLVTVKVGEGGRVRLRNATGEVAVLVDLTGWYDDSSPGGVTFRPVPPTRVLDTRTRLGTSGPTRLGSGAIVDVDVHDIAGVPSVATAVALNVTGVGASRSTDVRVYPATSDGAVPEVSNLNLSAGQTAGDAVLAAVGTSGRIRLRNSAGSLAVLADVSGWFGP